MNILKDPRLRVFFCLSQDQVTYAPAIAFTA
jgi:hypothetical protein